MFLSQINNSSPFSSFFKHNTGLNQAVDRTSLVSTHPHWLVVMVGVNNDHHRTTLTQTQFRLKDRPSTKVNRKQVN